jgi:SOS-response transcriptional repressor LexA
MDWSRIIREAERIIQDMGKSKADLAEILGVTPQFVADVKSGKSKNPRPSFALSLVTKLNFNPEWLLSGESEMLLATLPAKPKQEITKTNSTHMVPLLRQKVSCGSGTSWESDENIEEYIEVQNLIPRLGIGRVFAVKAQGSSMLGAGIKEGDYVFFDGSEEQLPHDGIYVFALDGEVYCKRLEFDRLAKRIDIYSVRHADLDKAKLVVSLDTDDSSFADRFCIFGKVKRCIRIVDVDG